MASQTDREKSNPLFISLTISGLILLSGVFLVQDLDIRHILARLLWPLARLMLFITIGLFIGQLIEASGWTQTLAALARPLFRFGRLGDHCGAAFTAAFFSGVTANAMLLNFFEDGKVTRKQLFLSNFINQLPAFFLHLPTTFFIVIPLTGWAGPTSCSTPSWPMKRWRPGRRPGGGDGRPMSTKSRPGRNWRRSGEAARPVCRLARRAGRNAWPGDWIST